MNALLVTSRFGVAGRGGEILFGVVFIRKDVLDRCKPHVSPQVLFFDDFKQDFFLLLLYNGRMRYMC